MTQLSSLFSPITLGTMPLANRLVMPPMSVNFGVDENGCITRQHTAYLEARARHGTGMITVGGGAVHPSGLDLPRMPPIWDDGFMESHADMVQCIQRHGVRIGMQLLHGGRQAFHAERVAPSPLPSLGVVKGVPRELNGDEIEELVSAHGEAARRCMEAGYDFVEIHAAHGYLIGEFLAPLSNLREDEWGGPFENRIRFLLAILGDIKAKCGPDYPVGVRYNGEDYIDQGWHLEEALRLAPILEKNGCDWLHVSAGIYGSFPVTIPSMYSEPACFAHLAKAVKETVHIPVIAVGRIKDPVQADRIIARGEADLVAMGRAHLADPALAAKAREGRLDEIRPCIGCCLGCIDQALALEEATCVMNPAVNREYILGDLEPAPQPKRVLVVGAGPAGLAAARLAGLRGHEVWLVDETGRTGGILAYARLAPGRGELGDLVDYYHRELRRLGVEMLLGAPLNRELISRINPQEVVIASGSQPELPQIEGIFDTELELHTVADVLSGESSTGAKVIVLGGGVAGLTLADFLAGQGKQVVVLNRDAHFAREISANDRTYLRERLKRPEVRLHKHVVIQGFTPHGLRFSASGQNHSLDGFTDLVLAENRRSVRSPADLFKNMDVEPHLIGDAKGPRSLLESQTEADEVGRNL